MTQDTKQDYRVLGTRPIRHDGADKVTGKAVYTADVKPQSMASGFILRSPHAHARIKSIDTGKAEALDGVRAVITGKDMPLDNDATNKVMAIKKVLYKGHHQIQILLNKYLKILT